MTDKAKSNQHIIEGIEPKYFARIPNMAVDDLNYAELALYVHYKRVASDRGRCYQTTKQVAKKLHMGQPKLRKTRDSLVAKGLIVVTMRMNDDDIECNSRIITIVNVWEENINRYAPPIETDIPPSPNRHTPLTKPTYEEELKEEEPKKKKKEYPPKADAGDSDSTGQGGICEKCGQLPAWDVISQSVRCECAKPLAHGNYPCTLTPVTEKPEPFQDNNDPDVPAPTPLHEKIPATPVNGFTRQPRTELPDGEEYNNGDVKPGPIQCQQKPDAAKKEKPPPTPQQMFGAICDVLGWDSKTVPKKKKARIGKCSKELLEVNAPLWKLAKMQAWAKKKFGDKWNMPYNLGGPEKIVDLWPTYWGETIDQNTITITVPVDPTPLLKNDTSPLISPIMQKLVVAKIAAVARDKTIPDFDPEKDDPNETAVERHQRKQAELYERLAIDAGLPIDDNPFKP